MIKAMVIDDEKSMFNIIESLIKKENLPIDILCYLDNGRDGLQKIKDLEPELVFIDIRMPIMNGLEVIKEYPNINYIVITAYDYFEYAQEALRLGAKDILLKPISIESFVAAIERAVDFQITDNKIINEVLYYLSKNYAEKIVQNEIAEKYFMKSSNFSRLFKKEVGVSFTDYLWDLRIKNSINLLLNTSLNISEIIYKVSSTDISLFYKKFKSHTGKSPSDYR